ncbi:MAG: hypothetical protein JXB49_12325 [Bacteroidales bacterium]|nr:hypothetical protein [Bacteroidales bacterium]
MIDIKIPIGLMFSILGVLLTVYGLFSMSNTTIYVKSFNINVNLWSGIFMIVFGGLMLLFSRRTKKNKENKKQ